MAFIELSHLSKSYSKGSIRAVDDVSLRVRKGEFVVFVGSSGCGKSTTLRLIAGLETPDSGTISLAGSDITRTEPTDRNVAMVFQDYALYPHMTVFDNIAFPLKVRKAPKDKRAHRVREISDLLGITELLDRKPPKLSGGQQQRVAIGRALVRNPSVFLMDEPLSNLDAKLRTQMRTELARIHRTTGATILYVTHDQTEAMTLATKIVVMDQGRVQQIGTPRELYNDPTNLFVAGFIGSPSMNFLECRIERGGVFCGDTPIGTNASSNAAIRSESAASHDDAALSEAAVLQDTAALPEAAVLQDTAALSEATVHLHTSASQKAAVLPTCATPREALAFPKTSAHRKIHRLLAGFRPEHVSVEPLVRYPSPVSRGNSDDNKKLTFIDGRFEREEIIGSDVFLIAEVRGNAIVGKADMDSLGRFRVGQPITLRLDLASMLLFDAETGKRFGE